MKAEIKGYLLDTNNCIYYSNALKKPEEKRSQQEKRVLKIINSIKSDITLYMSEATLGELIFGAENSQRKEYNLEQIKIFKKAILPLVVDQDVWAIFGKLKATQRKIGKPIADMDILIAATAKKYNLILVTNDSDLDNLDYQSEIYIEKESWAV
jgi:tRNA(fMet)-specific endonuclease VapC